MSVDEPRLENIADGFNLFLYLPVYFIRWLCYKVTRNAKDEIIRLIAKSAEEKCCTNKTPDKMYHLWLPSDLSAGEYVSQILLYDEC